MLYLEGSNAAVLTVHTAAAATAVVAAEALLTVLFWLLPLQPAPPGSGACGYGDIPATSWPSGNTAAVDPSASPFVTDSSMAGCGLCLEVECVGGVSLHACSETFRWLAPHSCHLTG